jgi:uncharacterized membrane protein YgcG
LNLIKEFTESTDRYLRTIRERYHIEILVAAVPSLQGKYSVNQAAAKLFTNWDIGRDDQGRGILLLLVDDTKKVKLEVGLER